MKRIVLLCLLIVLGSIAAASPAAAHNAPTTRQANYQTDYDPKACFQAATNNDKMVSFPKKDGPYTIGLSNSFIGNAWRTQMIQMAKAWAELPDIKPQIKELVVVSTGEDVEAQIAAMDNMIALGVDAIILNAATPTGFDAVIRRASEAGIIVVSFDNIVSAPEAVLVNEDQVEFGRVMAEDLAKRMNGKGNVVLVNGVPGTSVDTDRNTGAKTEFAKSPDIKIIAELEGQWGSGVAQQVMADFLATQPKIDGVWIQGGGPGVIKAFDDAKVPLVPMAGEAENGFRKALAERGKDGLTGISVGQTPGMVNVSMQAALELLKGTELPRVIAMPLPMVTSEDVKEGVHYFADLPDDFFTPIKIPVCGVNLDPEEILAVKVDDK